MSLSKELLAGLLVLVSLVAVPLGVAGIQAYYDGIDALPSPLVIELTAVARPGVWTADPVVGHNYWRKQPAPARPVLRTGEVVMLRLKSADVTHSFALPALPDALYRVDGKPYEGPIVVKPGQLTEVLFRPTRPGEYLFQCSTRCGPCHEEMLGSIVVLGPGESEEKYPRTVVPPREICPLEAGK